MVGAGSGRRPRRGGRTHSLRQRSLNHRLTQQSLERSRRPRGSSLAGTCVRLRRSRPPHPPDRHPSAAGSPDNAFPGPRSDPGTRRHHRSGVMADDDRKARLAALAARAGRGAASRPTTEGGEEPPLASRTPWREHEGDAGGEDEGGSDTEKGSKGAGGAPALRFRNYTPSAALVPAEREGSAAKRPRTSEPQDRTRHGQGESKPPSALEVALRRAQEEGPVRGAGAIGEEVEPASSDLHEPARLAGAAPRKANWDLKRDLQPKLDVLERRTRKAIVRLLRERLEREAASASAADELD